MSRARHGRFARFGPLALAPIVSLLAVGLARASAPAAAPVWPASAALLIGEVLTGEVSASDEFVEVYNASSTSVSLANLEVVYVTATGSTVTRKASWGEGAVLASRHHVLLGNSAGRYATAADVTYSGGLAATGGVIGLRPIGGQPLDAIAWGDAANDYVEGSAAPAPPPGSSIERRPGGSGGNWLDTNDNASDTLIQPAPVAQSLLAPPAPEATAAPTMAATETPPVVASATPTAIATPTSISTGTPTATATATATTTATATPTPTTGATPSASPTIAIADARLLPAGSAVAISGTVTADLGRVIDARTITLQDASAGIAVGLPLGSASALHRGDRIAVAGVIAQPYGNQLVQVAKLEDVSLLGQGDGPTTVSVDQLGESLEGCLVRVQGHVTSVDRRASATVSVFLQTASSVIRIVSLRVSGVPLDSVAPGQHVTATGVVGQRATQSDPGYRVWLRDPADLQLGPAPSATPTATPRPTATTAPRPTSSPAPDRTSATSSAIVSISRARTRTGQSVTVQGVATVRVGLLDADGRRVTIEDSSGGILVRLPTNGARPQPGDQLRVSGRVGTYYGAPQIGATAAVITARGRAIAPLVVRIGPVPERLEWRLVRVSGTIRSVERDGKAWRLELALTTGAVPVHGETRAAIPSTNLNKGTRVTVTGIVRRPRATAADRRFAVIPRGAADILITTAGTRGGSAGSARANGSATRRSSDAASAAPRAGGSNVADVDLARLGAYEGQLVRVGGLLVARSGLRLTLRDASGSADVTLPASARLVTSELVLGEVLNVTGRVRKVGQARWEVVAEAPGAIARVASLEAIGSTRSSLDDSATASAGAPTRYPDPSSAAAPARSRGAAPLGAAGLLPPALLLLGVASAALWAVGLSFRRRLPPDGPSGT